MAEDRPIKIHCNEEMRAHIEFVLRRYKADCEHEANERMKRTRPHAFRALEREIATTETCIKEVNEAGT